MGFFDGLISVGKQIGRGLASPEFRDILQTGVSVAGQVSDFLLERERREAEIELIKAQTGRMRQQPQVQIVERAPRPRQVPVPRQPLGRPDFGPFPLPLQRPTAMPAPYVRAAMPSVPELRQELAQAIAPGECPPIFEAGRISVRAVPSFEVVNPYTGRCVFYKNMGRPVLYSGDLAAAKRVAKVARRARSSAGRTLRTARRRR